MRADRPAPHSPQYKPYRVDVVAGETYFWCSCGRSASQPFCDGSHKGSAFLPQRHVADRTGPALFCGCKHSVAGALCDGSHNNLVDDYPVDDRPIADLLAMTTEVARDVVGRAMLDGGCFVTRPDEASWRPIGSARFTTVIDAAAGARHIAQHVVQLDVGSVVQWFNFGDAEVQVFVLDGGMAVLVGTQQIVLQREEGCLLGSGERFGLQAGDTAARLLLTICPGVQAPLLADTPSPSLHSGETRIGSYDPAKRHAMADRFYQVLLGPDQGGTTITQFIGEVPCSKAAPHRHLYEEAIVILSGEGVMWTETHRTPVVAGDVIFLPAEQEHSLQCTSASGMRLAGHFFPSGSPAINY